MSLLSPVQCLMGHHRPKRRNVEWDGKHYTGHCRHCGKPITRNAHRDWRESTPTSD